MMKQNKKLTLPNGLLATAKRFVAEAEFDRENKKMKKRKTVSSLLVFFATGFFVFLGANFQSTDKVKDEKASEERELEVATIEVRSPGIKVGRKGELEVSFDVFNRKGVQLGAKYGLEVRKAGKTEVVDREVFDEVSNIKENETVRKEAVYSPPEFLKGEHEIWILVKNERGLPLGIVLAGRVNFRGSGSYVELSQCDLKFPDGGSVRGKELSPGADAVLDCAADNLSEEDETFVPWIRTYQRSSFGSLVSQEKADPINLKKGEKKNIQVKISAGNGRQIHNVVLRLTDAKDNILSNVAETYYTVQGAGAMIHNVVINKNAFVENDAIDVSLFWSKKDESRLSARLSLSVDGQECADFPQADLSAKKWGMEQVQAKMINDCSGGKGSVALMDEKGEVLDEFLFELAEKKNGTAPLLQAGERKSKSKMPPLPYVAAVIAFFSGIIAIVFWRKKKNASVGIFFLLFLATTFGWSDKGAKADTMCDLALGICVYNHVERMSDSNVIVSSCPNERVRLFSGVQSYPLGAHFIDGVSFSNDFNSQNFSASWDGIGYNEAVYYAETSAPASPGDYVAEFYSAAGFDGKISAIQLSIPFTVNDCTPRPGQCGPANGGTYTFRSDVATAGYCSVGQLRSSTFVETATGFSWRCDGSNGSAQQSPVCTADRTPLGLDLCFGAVGGGGYDPNPMPQCSTSTYSTTTRSVPLNTGNIGIRWKSSGADLCRVRAQKQTISGGVTTWSDVASPGWTTSATSEARPPLTNETPVAVQVASSVTAGLYRYGIKCFNSEAGTNIPTGAPFKWLYVEYTANCTGSVPATFERCANTETGLIVDTLWAYKNNCVGKCKYKCPDGTCYDSSVPECIPENPINKTCVYESVSCAGKCGTFPKNATCSATTACGGPVPLPDSECLGCADGNETQVCNDCDNANWQEVTP